MPVADAKERQSKSWFRRPAELRAQDKQATLIKLGPSVKRRRTQGRLDGVLQGLAFEKFHGDEGHIVLFANLVDGANVGAVQSRGGLRVTLKNESVLAVLLSKLPY